MATIKHLPTGAEFELVSRHVVGRAVVCQLRSKSPQVSGLHAELVWGGQVWTIQDLGSRNGTKLDGQRLEPGDRRVLQRGVEMTFGTGSEHYILTDSSAPRLQARSSNHEVRVAEDDLLSLPSDDTPEVMIYRGRFGRWIVETAERRVAIDEPVLAGGRWWRVFPPTDSRSTMDATKDSETPGHAGIALHVYVSRDGEHVAVSVTVAGQTHELESRAHSPLLLALARSRLADTELAGLPETEHGWIYRDDLLKMLRVDLKLLNLWVFRARQQLVKARIPGAAALIERRANAQQLRLGTGQLTVESA